MIEFIHKNLRHAEYRLQATENIKKMSHVIVNCEINDKEKPSPSEVVGVDGAECMWYTRRPQSTEIDTYSYVVLFSLKFCHLYSIIPAGD